MAVESMIFLLVVFVTVFSVSGLIVWLLMPSRVQQRVADTRSLDTGLNLIARWRERFASAVKPLAKLSLPAEGWDGSA
jgi:tight adherence protein C